MPETFLVHHDLVTAFEVGWAVLYQDVSVFVAERLAALLPDLRCVDDDVTDGLRQLRRALLRAREDGRPWQARAALEVIAMLDPPAWASLVGLLDECPILPDALPATLERRTGAISASAFEFIATASQIDQVRAFTVQLPDILLR